MVSPQPLLLSMAILDFMLSSPHEQDPIVVLVGMEGH